MKYTIKHADLDAKGEAPYRVYQMPVTDPHDRWAAITDVPCPIDGDRGGIIRWAEAGYVSGYRICDRCGAHFLLGLWPEDHTPTHLSLYRMRGCRSHVAQRRLAARA